MKRPWLFVSPAQLQHLPLQKFLCDPPKALLGSAEQWKASMNASESKKAQKSPKCNSQQVLMEVLLPVLCRFTSETATKQFLLKNFSVEGIPKSNCTKSQLMWFIDRYRPQIDTNKVCK